MSNIKALKIERKSDPDVVDILEVALKQAKVGEITALALVKLNADTSVGMHWAVGTAITPYPTLIAGCTLLLKQLTEEWDKETERV